MTDPVGRRFVEWAIRRENLLERPIDRRIALIGRSDTKKLLERPICPRAPLIGRSDSI
jgi:hypothetical protein